MPSAAKSLALIFILAAIAFATKTEANPRENFAQAHALYSSGNFVQAKELFQLASDPDFPLADYSLYYLALISHKEGNFDLSREFLYQLRSRYPQSIWVYPADLQQAKISLAEKKYAGAVELLRALRAEKGLSPEIADEAIFLQAQAQEAMGDFNQAHRLYLELRNLFPRSRWTAPARQALRRLSERYPDKFELKTTKAMADEAERLVREREHGDAEILYKKILSSNLESSFRLRVLVKLSDLYLSIRRRSEAVPLLEQIAREHPASSEAAKAVYQIGQVLWNRHDNAQALNYFKQVIERYPTSPYVERSRYAAADIHESFGRKQEAIALYTTVMKSFPNSQVYDDAASRLAWLHYSNREWGQAYETFQNLASSAKDSAFRTTGLYWQGRTAEKLGDTETAVRIYRQIFDGSEESYYQALAFRGLLRAGIAVDDPKTNAFPAAPEADPPLAPEISYHLARARELSTISLHRLAVIELDEVDRLSKNHPRLRPLLLHEYFKNQAYNRSLAIANQLPSSSSDRNLFRFPIAYWEMIQRKAQERELDPYLILALIRQESLFDPRARSPATALGLMQLLPSTAARVAKQIGMPPPSNEQLFQPEINLTLGTQYLKDLMQRYSNDWFKAIAAYNAGETAVDRWEKELLTDDVEEFVERIPYFETRGYVKLVMRNHLVYKRLYDKQK
jgi:soluble lytic murein transglycosylase